MALRVEVDQDECMSSGKCVADLPGVFDFDDEELAVVRTDAESVDDSLLLRIARNCPSRAIRVIEGDGTEVDV